MMDVAARAGVSQATVSLVLNGSDGARLSDKTRERVRQIEEKALEEDLAQYQVENAALKTYHAKVKEELRQMKETSSTLYRSNNQLLRQIEQLSTSAFLTER